MKSLLFLLTAVLISSVGLSQELSVGGGFDLVGRHVIEERDPLEFSEPEQTKFTDRATGLNFIAELKFALGRSFTTGIGLSVGNSREVKKWFGKFSTVPIYALVQYKLSKDANYSYVGARIGYASLSVNEDYIGDGHGDGGIYLALSGGYCYKSFYAELAYQYQRGTAFNLAGIYYDVTYGRFSLNTGIRINMK